ncbi:MAG: SDR family NAD(P)-dependent oxidoreductase [Bacteroidetes bacterium]|nr:SDR family NAD(P)-dependent oxidoreductase [Bacteroidota bacterium]MDA0904526.1 SDR family NAD(P)-dependent oxidoreductase [Bacteroidota bacterium]
MNRPWVLISGASSGFGEATAKLLASRGWNLLLTSRREARLADVAEACRKHDAEVHVSAWDMRDREATDAGVAELMKRANLGGSEGQTPLRALVNNAGLAVGKGPFDEGLDDDWNRMIDTNVKGLLFLARACVMYMSAGSRMVNMGSIAGKQVYPGGNVYCASKHAVDALSQAMRIDLVDRGIGVSQVCPGAAETEFSVVRFKGDQVAADAVYQGFDPLLAHDIAEAVEFILSRSPHVNINDLVIMPTAQASAHHLIRS